MGLNVSFMQDPEKDDDCQLREVPVDVVLAAQAEELEERRRKAKLRIKLLQARGIAVDANEEFY
jgi:hypothetical protein